MSHKDVYKAVTSAGIKCRHVDWGDEKPPKLPWAIYTGDETQYVADDTVIALKYEWTVELYEERRDAELEKRLGDAILAAFGPYTKSEVWVKSERVLRISYDFQEIEGADNA